MTDRFMAWNFADIWEALAAGLGETPALLHGGSTLTWSQFDGYANALARYLVEAGARPDDKLAIYAYNRPEWLVAVAAAFKARLVPVNVNYRYRAEELLYLLDNSDAVAMIFERGFAANVDAIRTRLPKLRTLVQLDDGNPPVDWATDYASIACRRAAPLGIRRSPDDLLFIYTGGTTGMPKGVMWRQQDVWSTLGGGGDPFTGEGKPASLPEHVANVVASGGGPRLVPACPLMHGTGLLTAIQTLMSGGSIATLSSRGFDAAELWREVESKQVHAVSIVGNVFARPMAEELAVRHYDISSVRLIISSGVMFSPACKQALLAHHPGMLIFDSYGSSEATGLGTSVATANGEAPLAKFRVGTRVKVFTDDLREVAPGSGERGRVARAGYIPIGYYKDQKKTAETFPVIDGVRYSMPGDYATVEADGTLTLLGRGSVCINTGGEKVFPEEVEEVLKRHPAVEDAAVVGLPDPKWGQSVTAVVTLRPGQRLDEDEARRHVRTALAGYKVPKRVFVADTLGRSPAGKMDYKAVTARAAALSGSE